MIGEVFDTGLQLERTALAWRRTVLSLGAGSIVSIRLFPPLLGSVLWIIPGILGVGIAAIIWVAATYRYRDAHNESMGRAPSGLPGGGLVLFISCVTAATGCIGISAVLLLAAS